MPSAKPSRSVAFEGFPLETSQFLAGLADNNDKSWFAEHRGEYDEHVLEPAKAFVTELGEALREVSPTVQYAAKVNGSILRIHRDTRFSKDKTPYKPHLDLWFWEGDAKGWDTPGFFFRMHADQLVVGAGMHRFDKQRLKAYRAAVLDDKRGKALESALEEVREAGLTVPPPEGDKLPRGVPADHRRAELLRHEGLVAVQEGHVPAAARTHAFVQWCLERYRRGAPLHQWLLSSLF
jgi:uncharacterized protein (TIGR02453 family)